MDEKMKFKVVVAEGSLKAERGRIEAGAEEARRLQEFDELKGMELEVLGVPFGGHIMGRDAYGEAFHPGTDIWMMDGSSVPVTYYHGFGPDDPYDWQKSPAVIGTAKLIGMDEDGFRFLVRLDEEEELALRVKKAVEAGEDVKASSGAVGHLVRYGRAGLIDVWPVGELAIFDTNEWRRPANELAVVEKAGEKRIHPLINTNKHELEIASTQEQRLAMTEFHSDGTKTVNEITYSMVVPVLNQETKAAPEAADEAVKGAARLGREAVQQEEQVKPSDELVDDQTEEKMDELEMKALIDGVVGAIAPMIDEKVNARMNVEKGGVATQVQVKTDEADQPWAKPGDFFKAVKMAALYPGSEDARLRPLKATGMSEGVPADGGYLVPTETAAGIVSRMLDEGSILSRISLDNVTGNSMVYNGVDESTHVGSLYGGIIGYWLGEGGTKTASKPKFYQVSLKLKKIAALCYATDEQLEDTAGLESWLMRTVPSVLRWYVESAIVSGDGNGKPLGITQSPCLVSQVREDANEVNPSDFANMWSRRFLGVNDYVWLVNPQVAAQMNVFAVGNFPVYMPAGDMTGKPFGTLYGQPVIESEHVAAWKSAGDILLCSLSQYQAIGKGGVKSDTSIHVAFTTDETAFRFVYRIDGAPLWNTAVTPENGSTFSPFVSLAAASS